MASLVHRFLVSLTSLLISGEVPGGGPGVVFDDGAGIEAPPQPRPEVVVKRLRTATIKKRMAVVLVEILSR